MHGALDPKAVAELTTEIVTAYVAHQQVAATDVPALIEAVTKRLAAVAAAEGEKEDDDRMTVRVVDYRPAPRRVFRYEDHIRVVAPAGLPERRVPPPAARPRSRQTFRR